MKQTTPSPPERRYAHVPGVRYPSDAKAATTATPNEPNDRRAVRDEMAARGRMFGNPFIDGARKRNEKRAAQDAARKGTVRERRMKEYRKHARVLMRRVVEVTFLWRVMKRR